MSWKKISKNNGVRLAALLIVQGLLPAFLLAESQSPPRKEIVFLSLRDVSVLALGNNLDIQIARLDASISQNDLLEAESIFDTILNARASYENDQFKQDSVIFGSKTLTNDYAIGVSKKLPTGTDVSLDFSDQRVATNSAFSTINPGHEAIARISLKQSLGRNFFGLVDRTNIKITKKNIENADWSSLERIENSLADIQKAYWRVVAIMQELENRRDMLSRAEELYDIYKNKIRLGLVETPDLYATGGQVVERQSELMGVISLLHTAKNNLLFLLNQDNREVDIRPTETLGLQPGGLDFYEALKAAIENRRDYKIAKNNVEIKKLNLVMKKNSLWPEIDLQASFGRNGLMPAYKKAWEEVFKQDNPDWSVGITISIPIENREARGQFNKANLEQAKAILELKKRERLILTQINDLVTRVNILAGRVMTKKRVVELEAKKLEAERKRFQYGRSNSDYMVRYQNDLLNARLELNVTLYDYMAAYIDLKVAQNILLDEVWEEGGEA